MALIVITVNDTPEGAVVCVLAEPALPAAGEPMSAAQVASLNMLAALRNEVREDRGLIQLIN